MLSGKKLIINLRLIEFSVLSHYGIKEATCHCHSVGKINYQEKITGNSLNKTFGFAHNSISTEHDIILRLSVKKGQKTFSW